MSAYLRDNVFETSVTTGTGDFTLAGAVTGGRTFATAFSASSTDKWCACVIRNEIEDGSFETGFAQVNGTTLKRSTGTVIESSNSDALVNWGAGTKNVWCGTVGLLADRLNDNIECGTAGGTANAITLSPTVPLLELRDGHTVSFIAAATNTGGVTINTSSLGAKSLYKSGPAGPTALTGYEIQTDQPVKARYDNANTRYVMTSPIAQSGLVLRGFIAGLTLSNDGTTPNTVINVSAGMCADDTGVQMINFGSGGSIDCSTTGANALDTGSLGASSDYYAYGIWGPGKTPAFLASTSTSSPTMPSGYTKSRRIGAFITDASSHILPFTQNGDEFLLKTPNLDVTVTNLGNSAALYTLTVPGGIKVDALISGQIENDGGGVNVYMSSPDTSDNGTPANGTQTWTAWAASQAAGGDLRIRATNAQIRARASVASTKLWILTRGWIDTRGRFA